MDSWYTNDIDLEYLVLDLEYLESHTYKRAVCCNKEYEYYNNNKKFKKTCNISHFYLRTTSHGNKLGKLDTQKIFLR